MPFDVICRTFRDIASMEGHKSQERKRELISKLLTSSKDNETGYIMRALQVWISMAQAL